jgi:predicted S18 family serine protease
MPASDRYAKLKFPPKVWLEFPKYTSGLDGARELVENKAEELAFLAKHGGAKLTSEQEKESGFLKVLADAEARIKEKDEELAKLKSMIEQNSMRAPPAPSPAPSVPTTAVGTPVPPKK